MFAPMNTELKCSCEMRVIEVVYNIIVTPNSVHSLAFFLYVPFSLLLLKLIKYVGLTFIELTENSIVKWSSSGTINFRQLLRKLSKIILH